MSVNLKQDLINRISATKDENLLLLLSADFDYFTHEGNQDVADGLSLTDREELINMVKEPFGFDTVSQQQLDEAITQWRTR